MCLAKQDIVTRAAAVTERKGGRKEGRKGGRKGAMLEGGDEEGRGREEGIAA